MDSREGGVRRPCGRSGGGGGRSAAGLAGLGGITISQSVLGAGIAPFRRLPDGRKLLRRYSLCGAARRRRQRNAHGRQRNAHGRQRGERRGGHLSSYGLFRFYHWQGAFICPAGEPVRNPADFEFAAHHKTGVSLNEICLCFVFFPGFLTSFPRPHDAVPAGNMVRIISHERVNSCPNGIGLPSPPHAPHPAPEGGAPG